MHPADFGPEIRAQLRDAGLEPTTVLTTLDMTLLQQLQPCSCVPLEDIWAETREYQPSNAISQGKTKLVPLAQVHAVLLRLVHAAPAHLAHPLTAALFGRILPLMDYANTGRVDLALVLCVMTALADAPSRERLDLTYRLLMWRTRNAGTGAEDPVTRAQVIELLSTLKAVFEMQHQTSLLAQRRPRPADAQYVMFERFASDLLRFFPSFPVLPALSNPLSSSV